MLYAFLLSGEYPELAKAEVEYLLSLSNPTHFGRVLIYTADFGDLINRFVSRLALTKEVVKVYSICSFEELKDVIENLAEYVLLLNKKCCVRVKYFTPGSMVLGNAKKVKDVEVTLKDVQVQELEKELGAILWRKGVNISVSNPDIIIRIYIFPDSKVIVGILVFKLNAKEYSRRHPEKRPYFRPGVMLPKLCRALVNIALNEGKLLDPMCGTGGIVIEAYFSKLNAYGVELYPEIVRGCRTNLKALGVKADVVCGNALKMPFKDETFDSIVTDFPYFQSSKSVFDKETIYSKAPEEFYRVLKPGKRAVVVTHTEIDFSPFKTLDVYRIRVHSNLVRKIYVIQKVHE